MTCSNTTITAVYPSKRLLLCVLPLLLNGCLPAGGDCTKIGCAYEDGATFDFSDHYDSWPSEQDAEYTLTISYDGGEHICAGVVSEGILCDDPLVSASRFQSGMGDSAFNGVDGLLLTAFPGDTHLVVERDGAVVFEGDFNVVAEVDYPNGESCGPPCTTWSEDITW